MNLPSRIATALGIIALLAFFGIPVVVEQFARDYAALSSDELTVSRIIDGDTVEMSDGNVVRLAGIDTPERGECGFEEASDRLGELLLDAEVRLLSAGENDTDRYGRDIRYVEYLTPDIYEGEEIGRAWEDAGYVMLHDGFAVARYDSRDGYGWHENEEIYVLIDGVTTNVCE